MMMHGIDLDCVWSLAAGEVSGSGLLRRLAYILAAILFIAGIKRLGSPRTARGGNALAALGMLVAVAATLVGSSALGLMWVIVAVAIGSIIGVWMAIRVQMTQMPQLVALFNGFGGLASAMVAVSEWMRISSQGESAGADTMALIGISVLIGAVTLTGSFVAGGKLHGTISGKPIQLPAQMLLNSILLIGAVTLVVVMGASDGPTWALVVLALLACGLGVTLTLPIGGADMPVMVSLLNSYSGLAAAATGFIIDNTALIVSGALVGASGLILTSVMCKAMNRSIANVLFAGVGSADSAGGGGTAGDDSGGMVKTADTDDVAIMLDASRKVMIVPGYGLAVAQAQHAVRDLAAELEKRGVIVSYAVHPVAGRMPGHMNVLLAEADVPYDQLLDLDQANPEFDQCDAVLVIGANDVVNPAARTDTSSAIYGMPILDVDKATTVYVLKRSMAAGYAGVGNALFIADNTLMVFGDAKKTLQGIIRSLGEL